MSIFRGGLQQESSFFRHLVYWYLQQSCCVILLVIEMCVDHWWRESLNQPNKNNWQVLHCVLYASWKSSQRSQKGKISLDDEQLRILIRTKTPAKNHLLIQNPKWSFLILVLTFSIDKARGRPWLARQKPSPSFITQEVGRRCDSISNIQFSWHIVSPVSYRLQHCHNLWHHKTFWQIFLVIIVSNYKNLVWSVFWSCQCSQASWMKQKADDTWYIVFQ